MSAKRNLAILLAGGTGARFGAEFPKQFSRIGGKTILEHSIFQFDIHPDIHAIVVVIHPQYLEKTRKILGQCRFKKIGCIVGGGKTRQESSFTGIMSCRGHYEKVLIHDAARPLVSADLIEKVIKGLDHHPVIIPAISLTDTIIEVNGENRLERIVNRQTLKRVQTPQGFHFELIKKAHLLARENHVVDAADDCSLVARFGLAEVKLIEGSRKNLKITDPLDLETAGEILKQVK